MSTQTSQFQRTGLPCTILFVDVCGSTQLYETLGNALPHLHTHLVPRYTEDPRPGQPFPLSAQPPRGKIPEERLLAEAAELRALLR